ncbi:hypothetical protein B0T22DRAFT_288012 [Podospora appendiculata]|uniref:Uncharacterized protein n=1 Tax=Podospora appendiculata TaxID=314037 RepID=A0AAE0X110_9PEZI|nr:hypothetical protein B0T22DRAFT_288012 [Podospora appendiculata]
MWGFRTSREHSPAGPRNQESDRGGEAIGNIANQRARNSWRSRHRFCAPSSVLHGPGHTRKGESRKRIHESRRRLLSVKSSSLPFTWLHLAHAYTANSPGNPCPRQLPFQQHPPPFIVSQSRISSIETRIPPDQDDDGWTRRGEARRDKDCRLVTRPSIYRFLAAFPLPNRPLRRAPPRVSN